MLQVSASARSRRRVTALYLPLAIATAASAGTAAAQSGAIAGNATGLPDSTPVAGAIIAIAGTAHRATTDAAGRFRLPGVAAGTTHVQFRAIGYEPLTAIVVVAADSTTRLDVAFLPIVTDLPEVAIEGTRDARLRGFYERRSAGFGRFVTREDIERRDPRDTRDLLRGMPGVRIVGDAVQMASAMSSQRCTVQYFVDGLHIAAPPRDFLSQFRPRDLAGIEVYRGPAETPPAFSRGGGGCGVVALWTRTPGSRP